MDESLSPQALLDQITAYSTDTIMLLDREAKVLFISRTIPGMTPAEVVGKELYAFLSPTEGAHVREHLQRAAATRQPVHYTTTYVDANGVPSIWESRVGPTLRDGVVTGFVLVASNVTERHAAAAERDRLFELSLDLLCVARPDGHFSRVNPAFASALGYSMDELTRRPFLDFVHPDDVERTRAGVAAMLERGEPMVGFENRYLHQDGSARTIEWSGAVDPTSGNLFAIGRDVTETRALEQQLRQAQKMDAVGHLAGGIAHDFNNLLQAILGNVHFARTSASNPMTLDFLADIESAAERAAELTKKLLAFSRQQPIAFVSLDLNALVRELLILLRRVIPSSVELALIAGNQLEEVAGDRSQIEQVVMNLCLNARDALPQGGRITLTTENVHLGEVGGPGVLAPGRYVRLSVTDDGDGIPEEIRGRIFDPFFTTKAQGRGVGMGLATAYGIVKKHGGALEVESEEGQGATLRVYLPVATAPLPGVGSDEGAVVGADHPPAQVILVAEDEDLVRGFVVRTLERSGYKVLVAKDGREAIKLCQAHDTIALAILDVVMPVLSGPDAAVELARLRPGLPVLFSSGYSDPAQFSASLPAGAAVLKKPYRVEDLLRSVRAALGDATPSAE
ncbi:MAG: PAS domain S-box protein [Planctomycetes bacterium]|nr:PAS domain S-box protein [Planctomycetota bacterium]